MLGRLLQATNHSTQTAYFLKDLFFRKLLFNVINKPSPQELALPPSPDPGTRN